MNQTSSSLTDRKALLRKFAMERRVGLCAEAGAAASKSLAEIADTFAVPTEPTVVSGYVPLGSEIDCMALLMRLHERGYTVGLPLVTAKAVPLTFLKYSPGDLLIKGKFDVMTPELDVARVVPSILLVPLLAFDRQGYRLGYGGGFYDRTLEMLRNNGSVRAIGVAFEGQEVDDVPRDGFDQKLDCLLTPRELIEF